MGTHRIATHGEAVNMKIFGILSTVLASAAAQYPIGGLHTGYAGYGAPLGYAGVPIHAAAYAAPIIPAAAPLAAAAPVVAAAPVAAAAPLAAVSAETTSSQFRAEDEEGNTSYGYQNINNAAQQSGNALTGVQGSYSFRDEAGLHTISYFADALGYRVTGRSRRSVPVAPIAPIGYAGIAAPIDAAAYAAGPAAPSREAILTTIKLNPGHAVFYRVD